MNSNAYMRNFKKKYNSKIKEKFADSNKYNLSSFAHPKNKYMKSLDDL
jgi:hypothetical protein